MWSKIYVIGLAVGVVVITLFTYYAWSWLQSIGSPTDAFAGFQYNTGIAWTSVWLFSFVLLLLGNVLFWQTGRSWAMWSSLLFFVVCVVAITFLLDPGYAKLAPKSGIGASSPSLDSGSGIISFGALIVDTGIILAASAIVYFDHFIVSRLRAKTYPEKINPSDPKPEETKKLPIPR